MNPDIPCLCKQCVDPDQLASEEANWSGSALFAIKYVNLPTTLIKLSDWLKIRNVCGFLIYSAGQGLKLQFRVSV